MYNTIDSYAGNPPSLHVVTHYRDSSSVAMTAIRLTPGTNPDELQISSDLLDHNTEGFGLGGIYNGLDFMDKTTDIVKGFRSTDRYHQLVGFASIVVLDPEMNQQGEPNVIISAAGRLGVAGIYSNPNQTAREGTSVAKWPRIASSITALDTQTRLEPVVGYVPFEGLDIIAGPPKILLNQAGILSPNNLRRDLTMYARIALSPKQPNNLFL